MDEPGSLDTDLECSYEALEALSQDDEDEVEELENSLREAVQDQSVKPKLQCLMVDPSFSMVTVQSEDSGIVWETASSRCSTPWASETSSVSEGYNMDGTGAAGNITIIFDEEKVVRRRTRSGRSSRLSDRFSRPGSSRSASALGVERLEMMEVSQPNVKHEKTETEPDLEEIKSKDQQLFNLISEGYEILNISVPSKLPTVDEEESNELQDNLFYLDQTPKIRSRNHHQWTKAESEVLENVEEQNQDSNQPSSHPITDGNLKSGQTEGPADIDYFEKFTLLDVVAPTEQTAVQHNESVSPKLPQEPEQSTVKGTTKDISPCISEESFVFVSDVDIVGEHLDEVFYGDGPPADLAQRGDEAKAGRMRRQSSIKESGSILFESEETVLTPIYIPAGPPKIIDPILLEEPTAMSFMYSDLYEDAMGERMRSDEECSEAESVTSEKSYKRCLTDDCEEADSGYLEKFILKDETPTVEVQSEVLDDGKGGRMMWPQNTFEMTGCLMRVVQEEDLDETNKELKQLKDVESETAIPDEKQKEYAEEDEEMKVQPPKKREGTTESKGTEEIVSKTNQSGIPETHTVVHEAEKAENEELLKVLGETTEKPAALIEIPEINIKTVTQEGASIVDTAAVDTQAEITQVARSDAVVEVSTELPVHAQVEVIEKSDMETQIQTQVFIDLQEDTQKLKTPEDVVEVKTIEELTVTGDEDVVQEDTKVDTVEKEKTTEELTITQDKVVVQEDAKVEAVEEEKTTEELTITQDKVVVQEDAKVDAVEKEKTTEELTITEDKVVVQEDAKVDTVEKEIKKIEPQQEVTNEANQTLAQDKLAVAPETPAGVLKEMVTVGDELILLVPKGQAVEMDIEISPHPQKSPSVLPNEVIVKEEILLPVEEVNKIEQKGNDQESSSVPSCLSQEDTVPEPDAEVQTTPQLEEKAQIYIKTDIEAEVDFTSFPEEEDFEVEQKVKEIENVEELVERDIEDEEVLITAPVKETSKVQQTVDLEELSARETESAFEENTEDLQDKVEITPASVGENHDAGQKVDEQEVPSVITGTTWQDEAITPKEVEGEELDYEIITTQEAKDSTESEMPKPEQELELQLAHGAEQLSTELEKSSENKTEMDLAVEEEEEENAVQGGLEEDTDVQSTLKRFTPLEDLSGLHSGDVDLMTADSEINAADQDNHMNVIEDAQDVCMQEEEVPQIDTDELAVSPDVTMEDLEFEFISKQDTTEISQVEMDVEKAQIESVKEDEYMEEEVLEPIPDTEPMEVDYETIDAEEEHQAKLAAELQGLDWYCHTCGCLLSDVECSSGAHQNHQITAVDLAYEEIMEKLSDWISELQGRSENIEDLVSELELAYNSVEDQFHESEAAMQAQNEEMMALVMEQYNSMSISMEEEKKAKLEQLYDQIVSFQEGIDSAKGTLETTCREAETDARSPEDIYTRLKAALDSAMSLELGPRSLLVFEDYAKGNTSSSHFAQRKGIPVPQRPTLQAQEPGSANSTSVTVYWKVNPGDVIDCFQVYCMEDPQGAVSEEYRVTVKESYCVLEELEPDKTYKVWVMAVNYTGCSLPSDRLTFQTAPSVPVIDTERCTVIWDTAILRWSSPQQTPGLSYTLEYCHQYELEGEGLRSISGIKNFEQKVLLQPNENYLFYIKAVNEAGSSEQSEAALISTKGTRFHLLKATAHPELELSVDQTTLHYSQDTHETVSDKACPSILGELLPVKGHYYWETNVLRSTDYRLGVAYSSVSRDTPLGENEMSWCLQCIPTPTGCSYHLLHSDVLSSLFVIDVLERVGIFLDYQFNRLSFYNAQSGQLLGSFRQRFTQSCHAVVGMDAPGSVEVCMVPEVPDFTKDS